MKLKIICIFSKLFLLLTAFFLFLDTFQTLGHCQDFLSIQQNQTFNLENPLSSQILDSTTPSVAQTVKHLPTKAVTNDTLGHKYEKQQNSSTLKFESKPAREVKPENKLIEKFDLKQKSMTRRQRKALSSLPADGNATHTSGTAWNHVNTTLTWPLTQAAVGKPLVPFIKSMATLSTSSSPSQFRKASSTGLRTKETFIAPPESNESATPFDRHQIKDFPEFLETSSLILLNTSEKGSHSNQNVSQSFRNQKKEQSMSLEKEEKLPIVNKTIKSGNHLSKKISLGKKQKEFVLPKQKRQYDPKQSAKNQESFEQNPPNKSQKFIKQYVGVLVPSPLLQKIHVQDGFENFVEFFQVNLKNVQVDFLDDNDLSGFIRLLEEPKYTTIVKILNTGINVDDDLFEGVSFAQGLLQQSARKPSSTTTGTAKTNQKLTEEDSQNHHHDSPPKHGSSSTNFEQTSSASGTIDSFISSSMPFPSYPQSSPSSLSPSLSSSSTMSSPASVFSSVKHRNYIGAETIASIGIGYCHLAEQLSFEFNKSIVLWPCPQMKDSDNFLPSFEAISFAVKSIATKLNWTQVDIFVGDANWGLPLAIAANMHIRYKIQIGDNIRDLHTEDKIGKAIIITASMNDNSTLALLSKLETLENTKILLIDIVATSFNAENRFYKSLLKIKATSELFSNLLLLTVLSDNYRHFLNVAFDDNGIDMVQNFRQQKRWKALTDVLNATTNHFSSLDKNFNKWPIHLDRSLLKLLKQFEEESKNLGSSSTSTTTTTTSSSISQLSECPYFSKNNLNFLEICSSFDKILNDCSKYLTSKYVKNEQNETILEMRTLLEQLCQVQSSSLTNNSTNVYLQQITKLRNFIDFFNFYDFLISIIGQDAPTTSMPIKQPFPDPDNADDTSNAFQTNFKNNLDYNDEREFEIDSDTKPNDYLNRHHEKVIPTPRDPKYDFIVLDIIRSENGGNTNETNFNLHNHFNQMHGDKDLSGMTAGSMTNDTFKWRPLLILEQHEIHSKTYITHTVLASYDEWLLVSSVKLWHCGPICWTIVAISIGILFVIVVASVAAGIALRNYLLRKRLSKGPNKIVLSASDFVFPVDSRRVDEGIEAMLCCWLQQLQEFGGPEVDKPDLLKGSIGSLKNLGFIIPGAGSTSNAATATTTVNGKTIAGAGSLARHNPALLDMRARYNGDLVQLKEIPLNGNTELKSKAMDLLVMAHGLRHENINPLIGWLSDPNRTAMVFDYCSRGSLQDVLIMDEIKLDWSFRLSLLTDLVRGMRYLHSSPLKVHGALTSRNCVVDARWVLKITDYEVTSFYEAQGLQPQPRTAKELLWTAPELLRSMKIHQQQHHHHHHHGRSILGTQMGDVYSFGIIMQEVVVRGEPYCMLSLSADEIINKIKKPPPLIRPSVSKGAAPPEAINIMRQCWAEQPEMRPDFNSVYERFKMLNHGRKVNFVDTMFQMLEKYSNNLEELIRERTDQLDIERKKTEQLLNRMLPSSVAEKLKMGLAVDPEEFSDVTIYFSDIVGFTTIAAHCSPVQVVDLLNDLYTIFDATINAYNVYKVETIGDAYMVVSGLPVRTPDHADQIATMALDLLHRSGTFNVKHLPGVPLQLRIGLHTGPCCAGVVGLTMPRYCLFGDTVNTASRMESTGSSWRIHMSQETRDRLEASGGYAIEPRGLIEIKGKGLMNTFWLLGKKGFDKTLPTPPPIGLDESLIRNSITLKAQSNKSRTSTNPSSSQSSSLAGESVEVKVEITPPTNADVASSNMPNSFSIDSNSTNTISPNVTLCPEFPTKTPNASPQSRKLSEMTSENLLNPNNFNRLPTSACASSSRLYKKIEEMMDLSSPYNHYKCLSPSESNLTQFYDGKYLYSGGVGSGNVTSHVGSGCSSGGGSMHGSTHKFDSKPGSSRLLRRQFSLDRDDQSKSEHHHHHHQQHHQSSLQSNYNVNPTTKATMLDIPVLQDMSRSPKGNLARAHKQNSTSITQDLEKIEEIPISPASSQHHSSLDSNLNRSPPSTIESRSPPPPPPQPPSSTDPSLLPSNSTPPQSLFSAPTSPAPSRSLNCKNPTSILIDSPTTMDISTTTTTTSVNSNTTTPGDDSYTTRQPELTLTVETLLSR